MREERRLAAILAADMVGFSRLMEADERNTLARHKHYRLDVMEPQVAAHGGRVVNTTGDGLLIEFASVVNAAECAIAIQRAVAAREADVDGEQRIQYRMGVNLGDIVVDGDDILGDGVNLAARLEGLAVPGGVCLSEEAYRQVQGKLAWTFSDGGTHHVKNIARPVRAYQWSQDGDAPPGVASAPGTAAPAVDKPTIAVLPFVSMSGDPDHEYFADGLTEDIITELSRFADLFVIARNSTFTYKGRAAKAQDVRRDLGARYIVEGSVRRIADRARVTVQLIDAATGSHLWAERYDREIAGIFEVQDALIGIIVATLTGRIDAAEVTRVRRAPPQDMAALDCLLAGRIHHHRVTSEDNAKALRFLDRAIALDPNFAQAYAWKACTLGQALQFGFADSPSEIAEMAMEAVTRALSLDENNVECHRLLCEVYMEYGRLDDAAVHNARALALNPNDPRIVAQKGELLAWQGQPAEGVEWIRNAARLDPYGASGRAHLLGRALFGARRYDDAVQAFQQAKPRFANCADIAACHAHAGREAEARTCVAETLRMKPDFTVEQYLGTLRYADADDRDHHRTGLLKAGFSA